MLSVYCTSIVLFHACWKRFKFSNWGSYDVPQYRFGYAVDAGVDVCFAKCKISGCFLTVSRIITQLSINSVKYNFSNLQINDFLEMFFEDSTSNQANVQNSRRTTYMFILFYTYANDTFPK